MGTVRKGEGGRVAEELPEGERCTVSEERNGVVFRCYKRAGHDKSAEDWEHEARAPEYAHGRPDYRQLFEAALPLLEWVAGGPYALDHQRELAKALITRHYVHVAKTS